MTPTQLEKIKGELEEVNRKCDEVYGCGKFPPEVWQWIESKLEGAEKSKDTAYWERNQLVLALTKLYPSYRTTHGEDPSWEQDWLNIVVVDLPTGQASWHIHDSEVKYFSHLGLKPNNWDGHSTEEKYQRLSNLKSNKLERENGNN